ncbi:MAG: hypothetical protein V7672_00715 [Brevundimonas sp.]|uniref:hypothetical protein n=1 Tax=Brevundimonas sp. TaxID=1871086 RepID=UPI003002E0EA
MAFILPDTDLIEFRPELIFARNELVPEYGGPLQRRNRMGARYRARCRVAPQYYEDAQEWADIDDETETCVLPILQPNIDTSKIGNGLINGSGIAGSSLPVDGLIANGFIRKNQWLTITTDGRRYCYRVKSAVVVGADTSVTIPLRTMMRVPHADGDLVELVAPSMEGFVTVDPESWAPDEHQMCHIAFTITEVE